MKKTPSLLSSSLKFKKPPHILVIEARFYEEINDLLLQGVQKTLNAYKATYEIITVPGALEIPLALQLCSRRKKGKKIDAYVVIGCVIRGATTHYQTVCEESARGVTDVSLKYALAVGNGILTVENETQALERADPAQLDKGGAAAHAALAMLCLKRFCQ